MCFEDVDELLTLSCGHGGACRACHHAHCRKTRAGARPICMDRCCRRPPSNVDWYVVDPEDHRRAVEVQARELARLGQRPCALPGCACVDAMKLPRKNTIANKMKPF